MTKIATIGSLIELLSQYPSTAEVKIASTVLMESYPIANIESYDNKCIYIEFTPNNKNRKDIEWNIKN